MNEKTYFHAFRITQDKNISYTDEYVIWRVGFQIRAQGQISDEEQTYFMRLFGLAYAGSGRNSSHAKPLVTLLATGLYLLD